ncbi:hypothetical protein [Streptomyces nogalater]|uniref:Uncharacterized protein n=1 Tax=Streptomyces nogalater TaxID=38314 RepID=A0ABW0WK03_STRNO
MATDTSRSAASGRSARSGTASLEVGAELEQTLAPLEARMKAARTRRTAPRFELRRHDLRQTRETWFRLVGPDGQDPTPEGS